MALNTNYCAKLNFWVSLYKPTDSGSQLKWLVEELEAAERAGQMVHIVGHIPPEPSQCVQAWLHNYLSIVDRYADTIRAQFFGHTHVDELRLLFTTGDAPRARTVAYLGPSVTTYEKLNPAYRIYTIGNNVSSIFHGWRNSNKRERRVLATFLKRQSEK